MDMESPADKVLARLSDVSAQLFPELEAQRRTDVLAAIAASISTLDPPSRLIALTRTDSRIRGLRVDIEKSLAALAGVAVALAFLQPLPLFMAFLLLVVGRRELARSLNPVDAAILYCAFINMPSATTETELIDCCSRRLGENVSAGELRAALGRLHQLSVIEWQPPHVSIKEEVTLSDQDMSVLL